MKQGFLLLMIPILLAGCSSTNTLEKSYQRKKHDLEKLERKYEKNRNVYYRRANPVMKSLLKDLGMTGEWEHAVDAIAGKVYANIPVGRDYEIYDSLFNIIDSVFRNHYVVTDTVGSQRRFERAATANFQKTIADFCDTYLDKRLKYNQLNAVFYDRDGSHYFYLIPDTPNYDANGYLLYDDRYLVQFFIEDMEGAKKVIRPCLLKRRFYDRFLPIGNINGEMRKAASYYQIIDRGSIKYLGRYPLDEFRVPLRFPFIESNKDCQNSLLNP